MLDRLLRRIWLLGVPVGLVGAAGVIAYARPWQDAPAAAREVSVERATLRPGAIVLVVVNNSEETARVAQVILNDAFVDFDQSQRRLKPGGAERITVSYPWIVGEAYDVQLMTATGATIAYEIEEAEAGTQQA
jgi:zinc transporter, ZIP family